MSAVYILTLDNIVENFEFLCECSADLSELQGVIHDYRITHSELLSLEVTTEISNEFLKELTGVTVATGTDLNCYPRGLLETACFDLDGNPLP